MEEKTLEMVTMPDGSVMTFEECMDNLLHTRDVEIYFDTLLALKDRYLIILSVKDRPGDRISNSLLKKIKDIGFTNFSTKTQIMYIGIANKGNVVFNRVSNDQVTPVYFEGTVEDVNLSVSSKSWYSGNKSEIVINGEDYSLNSRGINIVVYDFETKKVIDSSTYDAYLPKAPFYHKNLEFDEAYFDNHIYMPTKYMESLMLPIKRSYYSNRRLCAKEVEGGIILPNKEIDKKTHGGLCDENFNFIAGHQVFNSELELNAGSRHISGSYTVPQEDIEYLDETVLYGGTMINHPGHLIVECFADRVWWFAKHDDGNLKVAVTTIWENSMWSSKYASFIKEYFDAFGVSEDRIIFVQKPTKFKKIIIPDQSSIPLKWAIPYEFTSEYIQAFWHIKEHISPAKDKKIYLTKKQTARKNIVGENYFIEFFKKRGFKIVNPEEYTIKEKAEILYGADEVVTIDGTNVQFSIFCKPTVKFTILSRQYDSWASLQQLVTEAVGIKEFYLVNVSGNFIHNLFTKGLTLLCVTEEFKKYVKEIFNEDLDITPEESLKNCLYEYLVYFPEYYSDPPCFNEIKNLKMLDVLRNMSEVFLRKEFDTSKLDLSTNESNLQNQVKDLTTQKNSLTAQTNALTEENKALKSTKTQNETELSQLHNNQNKLNAELLDVRRQNGEADKKIIELYRQKDETGKKLLTATEEKTALTADISVKKHQIDTLLSEKEKLTASISAKESDILIATEKMKSIESTLANANSRAKYLESELASANNKSRSFRSELTIANSKVQSLESELANMTQKAQSLEQECAELKNKITWMESTRSWRYTKPFRKKQKEN